MDRFKDILARAEKHHGGAAALDAELPRPKSRAALRRIPDHRYLAEMTRHVFNAGFVWRVIEAKWDGFEEAFKGFEPAPLARLSEARLAKLAKDERIVRNPQKIAAVRGNARLLVELAKEHGSAAHFFSDWPAEDIVGLWSLMKQRGSRLGGTTGPMFLRHIGVDTPLLFGDVERALREQGVIETKSVTSQRALRAVQDAFNAWSEESGRSLSEISKILACSLG
jgi:3-methyladenine DNA glycosylase Tag